MSQLEEKLLTALVVFLVVAIAIALVAGSGNIPIQCRIDCSMRGHAYHKKETTYQRMCWCKIKRGSLIQIW